MLIVWYGDDDHVDIVEGFGVEYVLNLRLVYIVLFVWWIVCGCAAVLCAVDGWVMFGFSDRLPSVWVIIVGLLFHVVVMTILDDGIVSLVDDLLFGCAFGFVVGGRVGLVVDLLVAF